MPANKIYLATDASVQEIKDIIGSSIDAINGEQVSGNLGVLSSIEYLSNTKDNIKSALVNRGISVSDSDTFRSYAAKVSSIPIASDASYDLPDQTILTASVADDLSCVRLIWNNVNAAGYKIVRRDNTVPVSANDGVVIFNDVMPSQQVDQIEVDDGQGGTTTVNSDPYLVKDTTVEANHTYVYRIYPYNSYGQVQSYRDRSFSTVRIYGAEYKALYDLQLGDKVKFGRYNGTDYVWTVVDTLDRRDGMIHVASDNYPLSNQFDAPETNNPISNRANYGNNRYSLSNARQFMNSTAAAGEWYSPQHEYDVAPSGYENRAGFLSEFTQDELGIIIPRTKICALDSNDGGGTETVRDTMWFPSTVDLGLANTDEGVRRLEYFDSNAKRAFSSAYWTSTQNGSGHYVSLVSTSGALGNNYANCNNALRPFCTLNTSTYVVWSDSDQAYILADAS